MCEEIENKIEIVCNGKRYPLYGDWARSALELILSDERLEQKKIDDFKDFAFYVKDYQRGYRWGKEEIEYLLDDIDESNGNYCMQPIVVKKIKPNQEKVLGYPMQSDEQIEKESQQKPEPEPKPKPKPKPITEDSIYELIDGQQRLTTLYLIMEECGKECDKKCGKEPEYKIYYEMLRSLDEKFIEQAKEIIDKYFDGKVENIKGKNKEQEKDEEIKKRKGEIYKKLGNLVFIWYELKENDANDGATANEKFSQINKGKIELTNAELFKAMLLNLEPDATAEQKTQAEKIAFEWDKIEQNLNNDDFWFFISNDNDERHTRIDYILELYAKKIEKEKKYSDQKERYSYNVVSDYIENKVKKGSRADKVVVEVWEEIAAVYEKLYSWYRDNELYNNIGFLVACENKRRSASVQAVVELYLECCEVNGNGKTLEDVKKTVKGKVHNKVLMENKEFNLDDISYEDTPSDLRNFLLYSNIYYVQYYKKGKDASKKDKDASGRFSFKDYYNIKSWDIEHINPQTPPKDLEEAAKIDGGGTDDIENKRFLLRWLKEKEKSDELKGEIEKLINKEDIDLGKVSNEVEKLWEECRADLNNNDGDDISNLVLLDAETNRSYHNAMFNAKRAFIIKKEQQGTFFLPSTRNVFLKYYSKNPERFICWDKEDAESYRTFLEGMVDEVKNWEIKSKKGRKKQ